MSAGASSGGRLGRWLGGLSRNHLGALLMLSAAAVQMINATLVKLLAAGGMDAFQIALGRAVFAFGALAPFLLWGGRAAFRTKYPRTHFGRALVGAAALVLGFYALAHLPLAVVTTYGFTTPLFVIVLSVLLLGESVRARRWTATAVGFLGVLVMARPGAEAFSLDVLAALGSAFCIALGVTLVKRFPPGESYAVMLFYFCVASLVVAIVPALQSWRDPTLAEWLLLAAVGVVGVAGHALILMAYRVGEASFIAPFDYSKLLFATVIGVLVFAEVPDLWTLAGATIIVASTLYIARREAQLARQGRQPPRPPADKGETPV